jgi:hypothetical protein
MLYWEVLVFLSTRRLVKLFHLCVAIKLSLIV